ncbi:MAG: hypothetical protein IKX75_06535, partial [Desulfovibrio sp.]|nr:hypothetical protein [Desulfovibrio sp.]
MENLYELPWLQPRNDAVFKCLFGKHADILQSFLENVLDLSSDEYQGIKPESWILGTKLPPQS